MSPNQVEEVKEEELIRVESMEVPGRNGCNPCKNRKTTYTLYVALREDIKYYFADFVRKGGGTPQIRNSLFASGNVLVKNGLNTKDCTWKCRFSFGPTWPG